ncbi:response regulator [Spirosoma foliorum]|uniref:Response regulator n=1 Tax=Spirosoma foliorum TaxID=2710596 RepID=A0A7G5GRT3_9BACT|nr:response regulator [Spirosoma foliorum]QMW01575.1 response regulator [Spirosoma foliorum]
MKKPLIYIVDDETDYLALVQYVFTEFLPQYSLSVFTNGRIMLDELETAGEHPVLILLDLHMPILDGQQTLRKLKQGPDWKVIPVVMVTSGASAQEVQACYEAGANSCLAKPRYIESMQTLFKQVCSYWVNTNGPITT